jgi:hypothetical protein
VPSESFYQLQVVVNLSCYRYAPRKKAVERVEKQLAVTKMNNQIIGFYDDFGLGLGRSLELPDRLNAIL